MIKYEFCNQNIIDIHNSPYIKNEHPIDVRRIFYNGYFCFIDTNKNIYDLDGFHIGSVDISVWRRAMIFFGLHSAQYYTMISLTCPHAHDLSSGSAIE